MEKLNLSFNQIEDLSGLKSVAGPTYTLATLDLHGNKLSSVAHIAQCLCRLSNLTQLVLSLEGSSNPVCHKSGICCWSLLPLIVKKVPGMRLFVLPASSTCSREYSILVLYLIKNRSAFIHCQYFLI